MQLNGIVHTMAASEPPEPPPRNPDKINASLKQFTESVGFHLIMYSLGRCFNRNFDHSTFQKGTKSLDNSGDSKLVINNNNVNNNNNHNNKMVKQTISLDTTQHHSSISAAGTTALSYNPLTALKKSENAAINPNPNTLAAAAAAAGVGADNEASLLIGNDSNHHITKTKELFEMLNGNGSNKSQNDLQPLTTITAPAAATAATVITNNKSINLNNCNNNVIESCQLMKQNMETNDNNKMVDSSFKEKRDESDKLSSNPDAIELGEYLRAFPFNMPNYQL